jgi:hypothetical protein
MRKGTLVLSGLLTIGIVTLAIAGEGRTARDNKATGVSFRLAGDKVVQDFQKASLPNGATVFVSPRTAFTQNDIVSAAATGSDAMQLSLTQDAARGLERAPTNQLAVYVDGQLASMATMSHAGSGAIDLAGISGNEMARIARMLDAGVRAPNGPEVSIVPRTSAANEGEIVSFDVFVTNAQDLRTYQIALDVVGQEGGLIRVPGQIDATRPDFIFGADQNVNAVDDTTGRLGGVRFDGGVTVDRPVYLGTFNYEVPAGASGQFVARVRLGDDSFLADTNNKTMPFNSTGAAVTVGSRSSR